MAVAYFSEFPSSSQGTPQKVADAVNARLGGNPPDGGIYHAEGALDDGGWWTFNVWASEEAYQRFTAEILIPSLQTVNMTLPQGRQLAVHWESNHP
jgi:hypothetical protein